MYQCLPPNSVTERKEKEINHSQIHCPLYFLAARVSSSFREGEKKNRLLFYYYHSSFFKPLTHTPPKKRNQRERMRSLLAAAAAAAALLLSSGLALAAPQEVSAASSPPNTCLQCQPFPTPGDNSQQCDQTTICVSQPGGRHYCACRGGYRGSGAYPPGDTSVQVSPFALFPLPRFAPSFFFFFGRPRR